MTETAPALPAGVVAVIVLLFATDILVAAYAPNFTVAPVAKFEPVIVIEVPPAVDPLFGETLVTAGAAPAADDVRKATICMIHGPELSGAVAL